MANNRITPAMDSRAALAVGTSAGIQLNNNAWLQWALMLSRQAAQFQSPLGDNMGEGGTTSLDMVNRYIPAQSAPNSNGLIFMGPTNDRGSAGFTAAQTIGYLQTIIGRATGAGQKVGMLIDSPRGDVNFPAQALSGDQLTNHQIVRRWMLDQDNNSTVFVEDAYLTLVDTLSASAYAQTGLLVDGLHFAPPGAYLQGVAGARLINRMFPGQQYRGPGTNADAISANNPTGCVNANPVVKLIGANGNTGTGGTGQIVTNWTGSNSGSAANVLRTYSLVNGVQQCVLSGSVTGTAAAVDILRQTGLHTQLIPGEIYEGFAEIEVDAGTSNVSSFAYGLETSDPVNGTIRYWDGDRYTGTSQMPSAGYAGVLRIPRYRVPTGMTSGNLRLTAYLVDNAASVGFSARCLSATLRRVMS